MAQEHPLILDLGSMFQETPWVNLSHHDIAGGGVAVVLLSRIIPDGARILFDEVGQGYDLFPFQMIEHPFRKSMRVILPNATISSAGGSYSVETDVRFKFLVYRDVARIREVQPLSMVQNFKIKKTGDGRVSIINMQFPNLSSYFNSQQAGASVFYTAGESLTDLEYEHRFILHSVADQETVIADYPFKLASMQIESVDVDKWVNFTGVIR